jgi:hypothetical protein
MGSHKHFCPGWPGTLHVPPIIEKKIRNKNSNSCKASQEVIRTIDKGETEKLKAEILEQKVAGVMLLC